MSQKYMLASCIALISVFQFAVAESPYRYFDWHVTYGHVYPLGVQQRVRFCLDSSSGHLVPNQSIFIL